MSRLHIISGEDLSDQQIMSLIDNTGVNRTRRLKYVKGDLLDSLLANPSDAAAYVKRNSRKQGVLYLQPETEKYLKSVFRHIRSYRNVRVFTGKWFCFSKYKSRYVPVKNPAECEEFLLLRLSAFEPGLNPGNMIVIPKVPSKHYKAKTRGNKAFLKKSLAPC